MRKLVLLFLSTLTVLTGSAQTMSFHENFEAPSLADSVISSGNPGWAITSTLAFTGVRSDSSRVAVSDTSVLMTNAFSTLGLSSVMLSFAHICKIEYFDLAEVWVSGNNGGTWTKLTATHYLGSSNFISQGYAFRDGSYALWQPGVNAAIPTNSWWQTELFDISALVGNSAQVRVKFVLIDGPGGGAGHNGAYGWLIDDIQVTTAAGELIPPAITLNTPVIQDTTYSTGPFNIAATITDASGVHSAFVVYTPNYGQPDTITMSRGSNNLFTGIIPSYTYNNRIDYYVYAIDSSVMANKGQSQAYWFYTRKAPSIVEIGTGTSSGYYSPMYISSATSTYLYSSHISLFTAAEMNISGLIKSIAWNKSSTGGYTLGNATYKIYLKSTTASTVPTTYAAYSTELSGATLVYSSTAQNIPTTTGWDTYNFNLGSFNYDGITNLMVFVEFYRPGNATAAVNHYYTTVSGKAYTFSGPTLPPAYSYASYRPHIRIGVTVPSLSYDAGVVQIVEPGQVVYGTAPVPVKVSIKNFAADTLHKVTIAWALDSVQKTPYVWYGNLLEDMVSAPVTIASESFSLGTHTIKAWTVNPNDSTDQKNINDTLQTSFTVCSGALSGTYSVGGSGSNFATVADAATSLLSCGVSGPVVFNIAPGTYTGAYNFTAISGASAVNTITFQSSTGDSSSVVLLYTPLSTGDKFVVRLQGASYFRFRNLTLRTDNPTLGRTFVLGGGASYNEVSNCVVECAGNASADVIPVYNDNTANNNNNKILNCRIVNGYRGLLFNGVSTTSLETGSVIEGNTFVGNMANAAIYLVNQDSIICRNNTIIRTNASATLYGIYAGSCLNGSTIEGNSINLSAAAITLYGIYATGNNNGFRLIGNSSSTTNTTTNYGFYISGCDYRLTVGKNKIYTSSTSTTYPLYMTSCDGTSTDSLLIANNMVAHIGGTSNTVYGLYLLSNTYSNFYHNSVSISGGSTTAGRALFISSGSNYRFRNNAFANFGGGFAYYSSITSGITSSDFNNIFTTGTVLAYWGANRNNLAALKAANLMDANSVSVNPNFFSLSDLHTSSVNMNALGSPLAAVPDDIDGELRDASTPDIGADEFTPPNDDAGLVGIPQPVSPVIGSADVRVVLKNFGVLPLASVSINWSVNGTLQTAYPWTGSLITNDTVSVIIGNHAFSAGNSSIKVWTSLPNGQPDLFNLNDTLVKNVIACNGGLKGVYTIGPAGNYPNFTAAVEALTFCGIDSAVVFNVAAGLYNEQVTIPSIMGASSSNTITFQSANNDTSAILSFSSSATTNNWIIKLDGAKYITLKSLTFNPLGTTYGNAVVLTNSARYNRLIGNLFNGTAAGTTADMALLRNEDYLSNNNQVIRNRFFRGAMGVFMKGSALSTLLDSTFIYGNTIQNFSKYGIRLEYTKSPIVDSNVVYSASATSEMHGISISYGNDSIKVTRNTVSLFNYTNMRGIEFANCTSTASTRSLIANNFVVLQSSASATNVYGMRLYPANSYVRIIHNSVNVEGTSSNDTRGINAAIGGTNFEVINNNVVSNRYPAFYETTSGSLVVSYSDFNNFYSTVNAYAYHNGTAIQSFTSQAALSAAMQRDSNSISVNPSFFSFSDLHTLSGYLNGNAKPLPYISGDIDGESRNLTNPDIGADEYTPPAIDLAVTALVSPATGCGLTNVPVTVKVNNLGSDTIRGGFTVSYKKGPSATPVSQAFTDTIYPGAFKNLSFTNPVTLMTGADTTYQFISEVSVAGDQMPANNTLGSSLIAYFRPSAPLVSDTTIQWNTTATLTVASSYTVKWYEQATGGTAVFTGASFTTPALKLPKTYYVELSTPNCSSQRSPLNISISGTPTVNLSLDSLVVPASGCSMGLQPITIKVSNVGADTVRGNFSINYYVESLSNLVTEAKSDTILPLGSKIYTFATQVNFNAPVQDSIFRIHAFALLPADTIHNNDSLSKTTLIKYTPGAPVVSNVSIPFASSTVLTAISSDTLLWYTQPSGGTPVDTGIYFQTPVLYDSATWYVEARPMSGGTGLYVLGTGTSTTSTIGITPYSSYYEGSRIQYLITAAELSALGINAGNISSLAFQVTSSGPGTYPQSGFTMKFGHTLASSLSGYITPTTPFSTVWGPATVPAPPIGWNTFNFSTPFVWDGTSNIVIELCHDNDPNSTCGSCYSTSSAVAYTVTGFNSVYGRYADNTLMCGTTNGTAISTFTNRPNMQINASNLVLGCSSPRVPIKVYMNQYPNNDAGLAQIISPVGTAGLAVATPIVVSVKNYGLDTLKKVNIGWSVNNVPQPNFQWVGSLASNAVSGPVQIGTFSFLPGNNDLKVWTYAPNDSTDNFPSNDTALAVIYSCVNQGTFSVGGPTADIPTIQDAINLISNCTLSGPVVFNILAGTYSGQYTLPVVNGASAVNTITFQSADANADSVTLVYQAGSSTDNYVLRLNGADYYIIKNLGISATGISYGTAISMANSSTYNQFIGNKILGTNTTSTSSNLALVYSASGSNDGNNLFQGNRFLYGSFGMYYYGSSSTALEPGTVIKNNIFNYQYYAGIYLYYQDAPIVEGNEINGTSTYTSFYGIYAGYADNAARISKNKVEVASGGYGIYLYYCDGTAANRSVTFNNFIVSGGSTTAYSIYLYYTTFADVYYNSVNNSSTGGTAARALYVYSGCSNLTIRNNIFAASGGGYSFYSSITSGIVSNNNNLFTTGSILGYWSADRVNLADWKTASSQDLSSVSIDPMFISLQDLHVQNSGLNAMAVPVAGITEDIDGNLRDVLTPDIGADEFNPPANDAGILAITEPLSPASGSQSVKVTLKNYGLANLTSATIAWSVNGAIQTPLPWTGNLVSGSTDVGITLGNFSFVSGLYTIKAWTSLPNGQSDGLAANDTMQKYVMACSSGLKGTYTIGAVASDYPNFTAAVEALTMCGVDSAVVFNVAAGTYNERISIPAISGASALNTITFRSAANDTSAILSANASGVANNWVVKLDGASYIILKNLTFAPQNSTYGNAVVVVNGARYNKVEACLFRGVATGSTNDLALFRLEDYLCTNNLVLGNRFYKGSMGILMKGISTNLLDSVHIRGNLVQEFTKYGIRVEYAKSPLIDSNVVYSGGSTVEIHGISLSYATDSIRILRNSIAVLNASNLRGIDYGNCISTPTTKSLIANNFISLQSTSSSTNAYGIRLYPTNAYIRVYSNSIRVIGTNLNDTRGINAAIGSSFVEVVNNNVVSSYFPAFYETTSGSLAASYSDYNNLYSINGTYAYYNGSARIDFTTQAALAAALQMDSNTVSVDPGFYSNTDLHVNSVTLNGAAKPLAEVITDIDGQLRNPTSPDIGADEFSVSSKDAGVTAFIQPSISVGPAGMSLNVEITIKNFGLDTITSLPIGYRIGMQPSVNATWQGSLLPGQSVNHLFTGSFQLGTGLIALCAWTNLQNDGNNQNDTLCMNLLGIPTLTPPYTTAFEGVSEWYTQGSLWQRGAPTATVINSAHSPVNVWATNLSGNYGNSNDEYLYSPYFDMFGIANAELKFWHWVNSEAGQDGGRIQYSKDNGQTWVNLGFIGATGSTNWYTTNIGGKHAWSGNSGGWMQSGIVLDGFDTLMTPVQFRFNFFSNASNVFNGWAIDDFSIELPSIAFDAGVSAILNPSSPTIIGDSVQVVVRVRNFGTDTLSSIPLRYRVNNAAVVNATWNGTLLPNDSISYTFATKFVSPAVNYGLCAWTSVDPYSYNDSTCITVPVIPPAWDAGVSQILLPVNFITGQQNTVKVRVKNYGSNAIQNMNILYAIGPAAPITEAWTGILPAQDSMDYTFNTGFIGPIGVINLCSWTVLSGDFNSTNDKTCKAISVGFDELLPEGLSLSQNIPNPASSITQIRYSTHESGEMRFALHNLLGQTMMEMIVPVSEGKGELELDVNSLPSGVYYYSIVFDGYKLSRKMVIEK